MGNGYSRRKKEEGRRKKEEGRRKSPNKIKGLCNWESQWYVTRSTIM
ncbi:MAG: hypothetical protein ACRCT1_12130 [Microcoleaceae cyanobacterium]